MNAFVADSPHSFPAFRKTPRAHAELANRERQLSSRLRQLLLLLEKNDSASTRLRDSLMTAENLDVLLRLELIEPVHSTTDALTRSSDVPPFTDVAARPNPQITPTESTVARAPVEPTPIQPTPVQHEPIQQTQVLSRVELTELLEAAAAPVADTAYVHNMALAMPADVAPVALDILSFADTQAMMAHSLRQACGLLAASLRRDIEAAADTDALKHYQARWKMTLLDSRYDREQLDVWINTVSMALLAL